MKFRIELCDALSRSAANETGTGQMLAEMRLKPQDVIPFGSPPGQDGGTSVFDMTLSPHLLYCCWTSGKINKISNKTNTNVYY